MPVALRRIAPPHAALAMLVTLVAACSGSAGDTGARGPSGASSGTLAGTVTNALTGGVLAGVAVTVDPPAAAAVATDATGRYTLSLPVGVYEVALARSGFAARSETVSVVAGGTATVATALDPVQPVLVNAGADAVAAPEAAVDLTATVEVLDGSAVQGWSWEQVAGLPATLAGASTGTLRATFDEVESYKELLVQSLAAPRRLGVLGVNSHARAEAGRATFQVRVATSSGAYVDTVDVVVALPVKVSTGLRNVPVGVPVLVQSSESAAYSWILAGPPGSTAVLDDPTSPFPVFTPDVAGDYTLTEDNDPDPDEVLVIWAGEWMGAISGLDPFTGTPAAGRCQTCHQPDGVPAPHLPQLDAWSGSGHASILAQNIETAGHHWSTECAGCHAVGYDPDAANGGFDEAIAAEGWAVPVPGGPGAFSDMIDGYPASAALANVQCENCHGPGGAGGGLSGAHGDRSARVSLDSAVCGSCHGEPPRHGRFQQWQGSGHANHELALDMAGNGHCARCHSAQGFLVWLAQSGPRGTLNFRIQDPTALTTVTDNANAAELAAMGMSAAEILPVTCAACHDPHAAGTRSGEPNDATVRVAGDTLLLPAGFRAIAVGRGAVCIVCHNTRNGLHDDSLSPTAYSAPHTAAQGDVLLGRNAYFVAPGLRSPHSFIADTCATCHMELTPAPAELSLAGAGTNHAFRASRSICGECHGALEQDTLAAAFAGELAALASYVSDSAAATLNALGTIRLRVWDPATDLYSSSSASISNVVVDVTDAAPDCAADLNQVQAAAILEIHGSAALALSFACDVTFPLTTGAAVTARELWAPLQSLRDAATAVIYPPGGNMNKALWNYLLLEADDSEGVHNPGFTFDVIRATMAQPL
jgi:hypothetical protein